MSGLVYFVGSSGGTPRVKIGFTKGDPNNRLRALQCGSPLPLTIYTAFDGSAETERLFHETFAPLRAHGEWFEVRHKLLDFMLCLMDDAATRRPADWLNVLHAIELAVLAEKPFRETDNEADYLASANTAPWDWMRQVRALDAVGSA